MRRWCSFVLSSVLLVRADVPRRLQKGAGGFVVDVVAAAAMNAGAAVRSIPRAGKFKRHLCAFAFVPVDEDL